jgi:hypothetical protein
MDLALYATQAVRPPAKDFAALQRQLDRFAHLSNEERPHQARGCPPMEAWRALDQAVPTTAGRELSPATKVRHDVVDKTGTVTLRDRARLHHIGIGRAHRGTRVLILMADREVRVIAAEGGELLRHFMLHPSVDYQALSRTTL